MTIKGRIIALAIAGVGLGLPAAAAPEYFPINPSMANTTVTLTGHDLTIDQLVQIARYGAKVQLSPEAKKRADDTYRLMNQASAEGVSIYLFNRGAGAQRETVTFTGDPNSPENLPKLQARSLNAFKTGRGVYGPEFSQEEIVRAMMVARLNTMTYLAVSPQMLQMQMDLLNDQVTPVMRTRAGTGEAQGPASPAINMTMVGVGGPIIRARAWPRRTRCKRRG